MIATLEQVLTAAKVNHSAVAGLVCLGWEDMRAYTVAAQAVGVPVILQAGPSCRRHTPLNVLGSMMRHLANSVDVPVVVHLDHGTSLEECREAIDAGFSSVMYDGSRLPLEQNIEKTKAVVELAAQYGVSVEGEIGFVGYAAGEASAGTDPFEASEFAAQTGIDAMAISVGNVHLQQDSKTELDEMLIQTIQERTDVPLVIHGGSGVPVDQRTRLAQTTNICKFNIGTELRSGFGASLRRVLAKNPDMFDRVQILGHVEQSMVEHTKAVLSAMKG